MKFLIFFFVGFAVLNTLECYDLEIEGTFKLDKTFMNELKKMRVDESTPENKTDTKNQTKMRRAFKSNNTKTENQNYTRSIRDEFNDFASNLTAIGMSNIQNTTKYLRQRCGVTTDLYSITKPVLADFAVTIKEKVRDLIKKKFRQPALSEYELEYMLLNIVEISSAVLYRKLKIILDIMLKTTNKTSVELDAKALSERIYIRYINYKRGGIRIMCYKFYACRQFPGFSDYLGDLISEILKLPKTKLLSFLKILNEQLLKRLTFIVGMLEPEVFRGIVSKLKESDDIHKIRQTLTIMRSVIAARYKLLYSTHASKIDFIKKTKAIRVLLDIFDKTFYIDDEVLSSLNFDSVVSTIRQWAIDKMNNEDLSKSLNSFIQYILTTVKHMWQEGVVTEINALTEIILLGHASDQFTESFLLSKGSHFVRDIVVGVDGSVAMDDRF